MILVKHLWFLDKVIVVGRMKEMLLLKWWDLGEVDTVEVIIAIGMLTFEHGLGHLMLSR